MARKVTIALVQSDTTLGDKRLNIEKGAILAKKAKEMGANIAVFPELFLTGYNLQQDYVKNAEQIDGPSIKEFCNIAKENNMYIQVGFVEERRVPGVIYNSVAFLSPDGGIKGRYAKSHLFAKERLFFARGNDMPIFETEYGRFAPLICYDIGICELSRIYALNGAECLLISAAWCERDEDLWDHNLIARSCDNLCFAAACNRCGYERDSLHLIGKSKFMAPRGSVIKEAPCDEECVLTETIDLDEVSEARQRCLYLLDRRPELYGDITVYS